MWCASEIDGLRYIVTCIYRNKPLVRNRRVFCSVLSSPLIHITQHDDLPHFYDTSRGCASSRGALDSHSFCGTCLKHLLTFIDLSKQWKLEVLHIFRISPLAQLHTNNSLLARIARSFLFYIVARRTLSHTRSNYGKFTTLISGCSRQPTASKLTRFLHLLKLIRPC